VAVEVVGPGVALVAEEGPRLVPALALPSPPGHARAPLAHAADHAPTPDPGPGVGPDHLAVALVPDPVPVLARLPVPRDGVEPSHVALLLPPHQDSEQRPLSFLLIQDLGRKIKAISCS